MELLIALFFGLIQGVTEFLPISTGGHLALIQNVNQTIFGEELFSPTLIFDILLRFGTLMAIIFVFFSDIRGLWRAFAGCIKDIRNKEFSLRTQDPDRKLFYMLVVTALFLIPAALLTDYTGVYFGGLTMTSLMLAVSGGAGILIDKIGVKEHTNAFFEQNFSTEGLVPEVTSSEVEAEAETAILKVTTDEEYIPAEETVEPISMTEESMAVSFVMVAQAEDSEESVSDLESGEAVEQTGDEPDEIPDESEPKFFLKQAVTVGLFQLCSAIPGISRSGFTVLGGLVAGFRRDFTVKYAFLSAIPVLLAKIIIQTVTVLQDGIRMNWLSYLLGMVAAFISGIFAIGWMRKSVRKYSCRRFGVYCLILGVIIFVIQLRG